MAMTYDLPDIPEALRRDKSNRAPFMDDTASIDRWRSGNPDRQGDAEKRWRKANPHAVRAKNSRHKHRRRSLLERQETDVIDAQFLTEQRAAQSDACAYCVASLDGGGELDHVVPVTKGGRHAKDNLVWACAPCNRKKSNKLGWLVINPVASLPPSHLN